MHQRTATAKIRALAMLEADRLGWGELVSKDIVWGCSCIMGGSVDYKVVRWVGARDGEMSAQRLFWRGMPPFLELEHVNVARGETTVLHPRIRPVGGRIRRFDLVWQMLR